MLYFFLVYPQQTVLIKVGEKQAEKDFIGYEFSNRRGHEGIKMYRDENGKPTTRLYDDDNHLNPKKANSYVYRSFLGQKFNIEKSLAENITAFKTLELMNFKKLIVEKSVSLGVKKKVQLNSKWELIKLSQLCNIKIGGTPSRKESRYYMNGNNLWVSVSEMNGDIITDTKEKITDVAIQKSNVKIVKKGTTLVSFKLSLGKTAIAGKDLYTNEAIAALEVLDTKQILDKYLFILFNARYVDLDKDNNNAFGKSLNSEMLQEVKIPLPPISVQEEIIQEITSIDQKEKADLDKLVKLNIQLNNLFSDLNYPLVSLGNLAEFKNGLNYSEKSRGDLVTIVGVKDFLEKFSPNLDQLVDVRIDGKLSESYKLQPGDILVVRSNGSANLVGRFIYIHKLLKDTSYSGFTIRIRTKSENRTKSEKLNSKYLCYCLRTESVRNAITKDPKGANIKSLNQTILSSIRVPLPPLEEQLEIINKAEELENKITLIERELLALDQEKEEVLTKYLAMNDIPDK